MSNIIRLYLDQTPVGEHYIPEDDREEFVKIVCSNLGKRSAAAARSRRVCDETEEFKKFAAMVEISAKAARDEDLGDIGMEEDDH
jgi:hypothetical protein